MMNLKKKYLSSAFILMMSSIIVKIIGAIYKIPLTSYIGAVGRGYFAYAYNIILPIHAITMGALPVALSKLTSTYSSKTDISFVLSLKKESIKLFSLVGFVGMALVLILSKPYSNLIVNSPKSIYTIFSIAPSILFSCMAASFRGYYEGKLNMIPTAISQTLEAFSKMILGLAFSKYAMSHLLLEYENFGTVLGTSVMSKEEAVSLIYPYSSAAAVLGVTLASFISFLYLYIYDVFTREKHSLKLNLVGARKELLSLSFPIMISCATQSIFQFIDTSSIKIALDKIDSSILSNFMSTALKQTDVLPSDYSTYAYGLLSSALDFKNLVPGITMALGVCAVPVISRTFEEKNIENFSSIISSIIKYTFFLSSLGGLLLYFCTNEILTIFYSKSSPDLVLGCEKLVKYYALSVPAYSLAGLTVFSVQAIGRPEKSILPFAVSGAIRMALNLILINNNLVLYGAVISGMVGYIVLFLWHIILLKKYTNMHFSYFKKLIFPTVVYLVYFFAFSHIFTLINFHNSLLYIVIIKCLIVGFSYCILWFLCGLLNFWKIFRYFNHKKIPKTLANTE